MTLQPLRPLRGFTLVEIMVAASVSSVLLLLLVQVLGSSQDLWVNLRRKTDAAQETRSLLGLIRSDVKAMFTRGDRKKGLVPFYIIPGGSGSPPVISFLAVQDQLSQDPSSQAATTPKSDLCIISYKLDTTHPDRPLVRTFSDSNATYKAVKARIDGFINAATPTVEPQVPTMPGLADQPWKDASIPTATGTSVPEAVSENLGMRVMAFEVVPMRLRRQVASPTGAPMTPLQLQNILTGRIAGVATDPWPRPNLSPEHLGPLPKTAEYDPDYSAPDVVEVRLVVADAAKLTRMSPATIATLCTNAQRDISDGKLDGFAGADQVLTPAELQGLSFANTSVAINKP